MAFTMDNTEGYTQAELNALNAELALRLAEIPEDDTDARAAAEKAFADEVAGRAAADADRIEAAYELIKDGLFDNARVNNVHITDGWDAKTAIDIYYADPEMGYNADHIAEHGELTDADRAALAKLVDAFLVEHKADQ